MTGNLWGAIHGLFLNLARHSTESASSPEVRKLSDAMPFVYTGASYLVVFAVSYPSPRCRHLVTIMTWHDYRFSNPWGTKFHSKGKLARDPIALTVILAHRYPFLPSLLVIPNVMALDPM
jgi:hypothetical protein